jgi:hypothetical protein
MTSWHEKIAQEMGIKHSDTMAVIRWGKLAKRATSRRARRKSKSLIATEVTVVGRARETKQGS